MQTASLRGGCASVKRQRTERARAAEREWRRLCERYLPVSSRKSIWRESRRRNRDEPSQGWKLHVSATVLSARTIFCAVAPYLSQRRLYFKAPRTLEELAKINSGISYGFSQIGKFITVYPPSDETAREIALELDRLTSKQMAPEIPWDKRFRPVSCVYYRYGSFSPHVTTVIRNKRVPAIVRNDGKLVADKREPRSAVPPWLKDPFESTQTRSTMVRLTPLETRFGNYEALLQRGRGGIYRAIDRVSVPPRLCIIKEGRRNGETDWDSQDGYERVRKEADFLRSAAPRIANIPRVIDTFRADGNFYLVMEYLVGKPLLTIRSRPVSIKRTLLDAVAIAQLVSQIHSAGWAWRECKLENLFRRSDGELIALDFETACNLTEPGPSAWATPEYAMPDRASNVVDARAVDLYTLGVCFMRLVIKPIAKRHLRTSFKREAKRRGFPSRFVSLAERLANHNSNLRPDSGAVICALRDLLKSFR